MSTYTTKPCQSATATTTQASNHAWSQHLAQVYQRVTAWLSQEPCLSFYAVQELCAQHGLRIGQDSLRVLVHLARAGVPASGPTRANGCAGGNGAAWPQIPSGSLLWVPIVVTPETLAALSPDGSVPSHSGRARSANGHARRKP